MSDDDPNGLNLRSLNVRVKRLESTLLTIKTWLGAVSVGVVTAIIIAVLRHLN